MTPSDRDLEALALKLGRALHVRGWRVAAAESCTGGWIAKVLTDVPGSSQWFDGSIVAYSNAAKRELLGVADELLLTQGAVSEATVRAMADGARSRFGVNLAVAVSGIAGPEGGTADKPVGTVHFAWATPTAVTAARRIFAGSRETVRRLTVGFALERLVDLVWEDTRVANEESGGRPDAHRVFFALWPDEAARSAISRATRDAVRESGGRPIAKERLHLTVAFLGELTSAGLEVARKVPPVPVGVLELTLDALGVWPESRVLWFAPSQPPAALNDLEAALWDRLAELGFEPEEREYRPHVTLARRARPIETGATAVHWTVRELALVESFPEARSVHYEVLETWPL